MAKHCDSTKQLGRLDEFLKSSTPGTSGLGCVQPDAALLHHLPTAPKTFVVAQLRAFLAGRGLLSDSGWEKQFAAVSPSPLPSSNNMKTFSHWLLPHQHNALRSLAATGQPRFADPITGISLDNVENDPPFFTVKDQSPWLWVLTIDGYFLAMQSVQDYWKHASLAAGQELFAAGELGFSAGQLKWMSLSSGHYMGWRFHRTQLGRLRSLKTWLARVADAYWNCYTLPAPRPKIRTYNGDVSTEV
ncbi:MAG: hypothetical protein HY303_09505 [Candidatus Wallbacteria bacterium]|nr:hypothetical protein [Candidatus Wallbacteria bacterium]